MEGEEVGGKTNTSQNVLKNFSLFLFYHFVRKFLVFVFFDFDFDPILIFAENV